MKSPLKQAQHSGSSALGGGLGAVLRPMVPHPHEPRALHGCRMMVHVDDTDSMDVLFGDDFTQPADRFQEYTKSSSVQQGGAVVPKPTRPHRRTLPMNRPIVVDDYLYVTDDLNSHVEYQQSDTDTIDSEEDDPVACQLPAWNVFAVGATQGPTHPPTRRARFHTTEHDGAPLCLHYESSRTLYYASHHALPPTESTLVPDDATHRTDVNPTDTDTDATIRDRTWYGVADFRQFRAWFHETVAAAVGDEPYRDTFLARYAVVCASCPTTDARMHHPAALAFSADDAESNDIHVVTKYRGLERAIFRHELQTDKLAALKGVVWAQANCRRPAAASPEEDSDSDCTDHGLVDDPMSDVEKTMHSSVEALLAQTSMALTAHARRMAAVLGAADAAVARAIHHEPVAHVRRFVEI